MNEVASRAIEELWENTVKARALCPGATPSAIGRTDYCSPEWYSDRGAIYFVKPAKPLKAEDIDEMNHIGDFINRSFVISMAALLEKQEVIPKGRNLNDLELSREGGKHVQLTKWLRNQFAHADYVYDKDEPFHQSTNALLMQLFPGRDPGFSIPIDTVLEPLKDGVLDYIRAAT